MAEVMPSVQSQQPQVLSWSDVNEPGAYVEVSTGDLYRVPSEAISRGASLLVTKESASPIQLMKISPNPFVTTLEARKLAAQANISPNF